MYMFSFVSRHMPVYYCCNMARTRLCFTAVITYVLTRCQKGRNNQYIAFIQTLYDVGSSYVPEDPAQVEFCASWNWVDTCRGIHFKSKLQHTETWSSDSMTAPPLVLSPNSILPLLILIALFSSAWENRRAFQISFCFGRYYFKKKNFA
jgi:hypothetical protein